MKNTFKASLKIMMGHPREGGDPRNGFPTKAFGNDKLLLGAKYLLITFIVFLLSPHFPVWASEAQMMDLINKMQQDMSEMRHVMEMQNQKIVSLEGQVQSLHLPAPSGEGTASGEESAVFAKKVDQALGGNAKWLRDIKPWGDVRLRYEGTQYRSGDPSETDDRNQFRFRVRYGLDKTFTPEIKAGFALASGETNGGVNSTPGSNNVSFDNNFGFKPIWIERAYAAYMPSFLASKWILEKTEVTAGKVLNPFEKGSSEMVWDRDVKPEGVYEKLDFKLLESDDFKLAAYTTTGQFVLDEDTTVGGDANLYAYQMGLAPSLKVPGLEKPVEFLSAASFYDFSNYARKNNFTINGTSLARGNSNADAVTTELDAGRFEILDLYQEMTVTLHNIPSRLFVEWVRNPADSADSGVLHDSNAHAFGIKVGQAVKKGDLELAYQYRHLGANSLVGAFSDSDFGDSLGGASHRGSVVKAAYALTDNVTLGVGGFFLNTLNSGTAGNIDQNSNRLTVDLNLKF